jgi:hypothetical protein
LRAIACRNRVERLTYGSLDRARDHGTSFGRGGAVAARNNAARCNPQSRSSIVSLTDAHGVQTAAGLECGVVQRCFARREQATAQTVGLDGDPVTFTVLPDKENGLLAKVLRTRRNPPFRRGKHGIPRVTRSDEWTALIRSCFVRKEARWRRTEKDQNLTWPREASKLRIFARSSESGRTAAEEVQGSAWLRPDVARLRHEPVSRRGALCSPQLVAEFGAPQAPRHAGESVELVALRRGRQQ